MELIAQPMLYWALDFVCVRNVECETFWGVPVVSAEEREEILGTVRRRIEAF